MIPKRTKSVIRHPPTDFPLPRFEDVYILGIDPASEKTPEPTKIKHPVTIWSENELNYWTQRESPTSRDYLFGYLLGFFFGVIAGFFVGLALGIAEGIAQ